MELISWTHPDAVIESVICTQHTQIALEWSAQTAGSLVEIVIFRKYVADVLCNTCCGSIGVTSLSATLAGWGTSICKAGLFQKRLFGTKHAIPERGMKGIHRAGAVG